MNPMNSIKEGAMETEGTIQLDVSDESTIQQDVVDLSGAPINENNDDDNLPLDPVSKREAKIAALAESRRAEVAEQQKQYWLINNPEQSETDYQSMLQRVEEANANDDDAGDRGESIVDEKPKPVAISPSNGWEVVNGQRVKVLMVNGTPRQISEADYDRMVQKELAGDEKLRQAAQQTQELQRRQQELDERDRQFQARQAAPKIDAGEALRVKIKEHTELLLEGDVDAANEKMMEILVEGRASPTPNLDELTTRVATQVETKVKREAAQAALDGSVSEGWNHLLENYPDVVGNEDAITFADIQIKKVKAEHPEWPPKQVIIESARLTRSKLKLTAPATPGAGKVTTTNKTAERMERKANIRPLPTASGKRHEKPAAKPVDMSPKAKIDRMRAGRAV